MLTRAGAITASLLALLLGLAVLDLGWPIWLAALLWVAALGCLYYVLAGLAVVAIFLRAALAFVPVAALSYLLVVQVVQSDLLGSGEKRALIAAVAVAGGWVVAFVTGEMRQTNQEQERRRDIIRATLAEVDLMVDWARPIDWSRARTDMEENFRRDRNYAVFVAYGHQFETLKRLVAQIEILGKHQIARVTDFFQLLDRLERMETQMRSDLFQTLPWERRRATVLRYLELQSQVADAGEVAAQALRERPFHGWMRRLT